MTEDSTSEKPEKNSNSADADRHISYRRCSDCNCEKMEPVSALRETGFVAMTTFGQVYQCPECASQVNIRAIGSIVTGSIFAAIIAWIGWLAFINGPYWYATNLQYFELQSYETSMILIDLLVFVVYSAVAIYAAWNLWSEVFLPIKAIVQHPISGENRALSEIESGEYRKIRKMQLLGFFLFPLIVYVPLLGAIWLLDQSGIDIRGNEIYKFATLAATFGFAIFLAKRFKVEFGLVFFGMVVWMAAFVGFVFLMR